ncbi:transmembrane protein, putative (macronuclear) [Tetrahymena thermophila SB210]|uniref:Transmembrane protein, putative n=1 Tax=Tetrahymena thermophila (strain SB210) TaxID=312017 RepID=Q246B3_TETTS|nr:transmembrane protein, putative [Tetrahymena thermophila SB210]EAS03470.2 transmembrane protein, putative [Tetrahymena thermophila SB210]|eukprot:XP_001023715.2 transmembrane protein, putative [Tetrahymena thermophila SB210]
MIGSQELMNERGDQKKLESKNKLLFEQRTGYIKDYQHNLSSDLESYNNLELEASNVNNNNDVDIKFNPTTFFVIFVLQYITYLVYVVFIPFIVYKDNFINSDLAYLKEKTWAWICLWSYSIRLQQQNRVLNV